MSQTVSHAYVMGIGEGRSLLRRHEADLGPISLQDARGYLRNCEECLTMGFAGDIRDMMRGERDFWRGQIKRLAEQRAREGVAA